jgi:glucokinase
LLILPKGVDALLIGNIGRMNLIGVDIGGSHISVGQITWDGNEVHIDAFYEADVDTSVSAEEIITDWAKIIKRAVSGSSEPRVGVAMPGPYDYENGISLIQDQGKMRSLYGLSVKNLLATSLDLSPKRISFTNDAEAFLWGESFAGAGRGLDRSIGLTLGTGLGSAFKAGDKVWDGKLWTSQFRDGIAEGYLGTDWVKRYMFESRGVTVSGFKELFSGDFSHEVVEEVMSTFGEALGEFLLPQVTEMQCQGLVLGGKISRVSAHFLPYTKAYLEKQGCPLEIRISELEEKAALIGACHSYLM